MPPAVNAEKNRFRGSLPKEIGLGIREPDRTVVTAGAVAREDRGAIGRLRGQVAIVKLAIITLVIATTNSGPPAQRRSSHADRYQRLTAASTHRRPMV
jgi:hypothetical protein